MNKETIKQKILDRLPDWFNKSDSTLLSIIIDILSQAITELGDATDDAIESMILQNSTGEFLEYWGEWYGIPRIMGESDLQYAIRILSEIKLPKQTIPSIKTYLSNILGIDESDISVYEPYRNLITLSGHGTLSGRAKMTDADYWNWTVIDIKAPVPYNDYVREVLQKIKAGGIKVFWSYLVKTDPSILNIQSQINITTIYSKHYYSTFDFYRTFGLDNNDGSLSGTGNISGVQIIRSLITLYFQPYLSYLPNLDISLEVDQIYTSIGYGTQGYGTTWYGGHNPV